MRSYWIRSFSSRDGKLFRTSLDQLLLNNGNTSISTNFLNTNEFGNGQSSVFLYYLLYTISSLFQDCRIQNIHITINQYHRDDEEKQVKTMKLKNECENAAMDVFEEEPPFKSNRIRNLLNT